MTGPASRPLDLLWFIPTSGDGRSVLDLSPDSGKNAFAQGRKVDLGYLRLVAQAADRLGFAGALLPTGSQCEDAWVIASALAADTERLRFMVALRPGFVLPTVAAQMTATLQRISGGRALLNIVTGGEASEQRSYGDFLDHDARYERTDEFLTVFRRCWSGEPFDFSGQHYQIEDGGIGRPFGEKFTPGQGGAPEIPPVYFGGASPAAELVAARHTDVYLLWGEPPDWVAERVASVRAKAQEEGRTMRFGIRLHVIARPREEDAWGEAERILAAMPPEQIERVQQRFAKTESVGQQRMARLHNGRVDMESLTIAPNLWAGVGLVRRGAGTALVGSYDQVADRIREYAAIGLDTFILSGYPHLEEAYVVGEEVLPRLRNVTASVTS